MEHPAEPRDTGDNDDRQVVFSAAQHRFAVPYAVVLQMVSPPPAVAVPNVHPALRGVINLRGEVLGLVCLRQLLGGADIARENGELVAELERREQDHRRWLAELTASVNEDRAFGLTTDPHACAFGRWYDHYVPPNDNMAALVKRFDAPHQRIHAVAQRVETLRRTGLHAEAMEVIRQAEETDFLRLVRQFAEVRESLSGPQRQIAIVLRGSSRAPIALLVDVVESVTTLESVADGGQDGDPHGLVAGIARDASGRLVNRLDLDAIYRIIES